MKPKIVMGFAGVVLACAIGISLYARWHAGAIIKHDNLVGKLPVAVSPWTQKDMDIASSAEMKQAVNELLNYDQAVFREYENRGRKFSVYVAYWKPRKFHPRLIAIHTPDVCWVGNGWKMEEANYDYPVPLAKGAAWPAQYREFTMGGVRTYVLYWHIVNERLSGYASGIHSRQSSFIKSLIGDLRGSAGEQFFIRISSDQPWSEWKDDSLFRSVLDTFSPVLLARPEHS